jgi:hypothetical protein
VLSLTPTTFAAAQVTYKRLQETLQQLSGPGTDRRADLLPGMALVDALFDRREPRFAAAAPAWKPVNSRLDESQRRAVELALRAQDVALIHGPPGDLSCLLLLWFDGSIAGQAWLVQRFDTASKSICSSLFSN